MCTLRAVMPMKHSSIPCNGSASIHSRNVFMPLLIKAGAVADDRWTLIREPDAELSSFPEDADLIVPLSIWQTRRDELPARSEGIDTPPRQVGVWLRPNDEPAALANDVEALRLIAI